MLIFALIYYLDTLKLSTAVLAFMMSDYMIRRGRTGALNRNASTFAIGIRASDRFVNHRRFERPDRLTIDSAHAPRGLGCLFLAC